MKLELLRKVIELSERTKHCLIATVDEEGVPHVAASKKISLDQGNNIVITEWFCPNTITNIMGSNHNISIVVWHKETDSGYQVLGTVQDEKDLAYMDGYSPVLDEQASVPQIQRRLTVQVGKIMDFKIEPHTDVEKE